MSPVTVCITCGRKIPRGQSHCKAHKRGGSTRQWRALRQQILARDRYTCQLCGAAAEHVDHKRPVIDGGSDQPGNLQAICAECNLRKGGRRIAKPTRPADTPHVFAGDASKPGGGSLDGR